MAVGNTRSASFSMRVSSKAHYGLRMMTEFAKAYGRGPLSLAEVARVEHLPLAYLEQLAGPLRRGGLIEATRGAHGGYVLTRSPEEITVLDVVALVEGEVAPVECVSHEYEAGCCVRDADCASRTLWQRLKESVDAVLNGTTLAELVCEGGRPPVSMFIPLEDVRGTSPSPHRHEAAHV